jgi:hypothetical protein
LAVRYPGGVNDTKENEAKGGKENEKEKEKEKALRNRGRVPSLKEKVRENVLKKRKEDEIIKQIEKDEKEKHDFKIEKTKENEKVNLRGDYGTADFGPRNSVSQDSGTGPRSPSSEFFTSIQKTAKGKLSRRNSENMKSEREINSTDNEGDSENTSAGGSPKDRESMSDEKVGSNNNNNNNNNNNSGINCTLRRESKSRRRDREDADARVSLSDSADWKKRDTCISISESCPVTNHDIRDEISISQDRKKCQSATNNNNNINDIVHTGIDSNISSKVMQTGKSEKSTSKSKKKNLFPSAVTAHQSNPIATKKDKRKGKEKRKSNALKGKENSTQSNSEDTPKFPGVNFFIPKGPRVSFIEPGGPPKSRVIDGNPSELESFFISHMQLDGSSGSNVEVENEVENGADYEGENEGENGVENEDDEEEDEEEDEVEATSPINGLDENDIDCESIIYNKINQNENKMKEGVIKRGSSASKVREKDDENNVKDSPITSNSCSSPLHTTTSFRTKSPSVTPRASASPGREKNDGTGNNENEKLIDTMAQVIRRASFPNPETASSIVGESANLRTSPSTTSSGPTLAAGTTIAEPAPVTVAVSSVKKGVIAKDTESSFDRGYGGITLSFSDSMNDQTDYTIDLEVKEGEKEKENKVRMEGKHGPKVAQGQAAALKCKIEEDAAPTLPCGVPEAGEGDGGGEGGEEEAGVAFRSKRSSASEKESDRVACGDNIADSGWFVEDKGEDKGDGKKDGTEEDREGGDDEGAREQSLRLSTLLERSLLLDEGERDIESSGFMAAYTSQDDCGDDTCVTGRQSEHGQDALDVSGEKKQDEVIAQDEVMRNRVGESQGKEDVEGEVEEVKKKEGEKGESEEEKVEKEKEKEKGTEEVKDSEKYKGMDSAVINAVSAAKKRLHKEGSGPIFDALLCRRSSSEPEHRDGERRKSKESDDLSAMSGNISAISSLGGTLRSSTVHRAFRDYVAAEGETSDKCVSYVSSNSSSAFFSLSCSPSTPFPVFPLSYFTEPRLSASAASGCDLPFAPKLVGTTENGYEGEKEVSGGEKGSISSIEEGIAYEYATTGRDNESDYQNSEDHGSSALGGEGCSISGKQSGSLFNSLQNVGSNKYSAYSTHRDSHSFKGGANKSSRSGKRVSGNPANSGQSHSGDHGSRPNNISLPGSIDKSELSSGRRVRSERRSRENANGHSNRLTGDHNDDSGKNLNINSNSNSTAADRATSVSGSHKDRNLKNDHSNIHDTAEHHSGTNARDARTIGSGSGSGSVVNEPLSQSATKSSSTKKLLQDFSLSIFPSSFKRSHQSFVSNMRLKTENEKIT